MTQRFQKLFLVKVYAPLFKDNIVELIKKEKNYMRKMKNFPSSTKLDQSQVCRSYNLNTACHQRDIDGASASF